jgi:CO/xanthine dehydrogenase FAD-binding subunit
MRRYAYLRPGSLAEVFRLREDMPDAQFVGGGTDLMVKIKNREASPSTLISLRSIPELQGIDIRGAVRIGAMTTITDLVKNDILRSRYPVLVQAARRLGSVQIRNVATLGGNLCNCSPCADTATPLLVLETRAVLQSPRGAREIPLSELFKQPGETCMASDEILVRVLIPAFNATRKGSGVRAVFFKKGRVKMDLAVASLSVLIQTEGDKVTKARLAAGSVAPVPLRLTKVEELLVGKNLSGKLIGDAAQLAEESVAPISDIRSTAEYRRHMVGVFTKRALESLWTWSEA